MTGEIYLTNFALASGGSAAASHHFACRLQPALSNRISPGVATSEWADWPLPGGRCRSKHSASELHAMARVLSGGSIYVSDYPGQHDFDILKRLVRGFIPRCHCRS